MLSVLATRIRTLRQAATSLVIGSVYEGFLITEPVVGRGMVIFRDPHGHHMVTTMVQRVFTTSERSMLYVETENSVYRLKILEQHPAEQSKSA